MTQSQKLEALVKKAINNGFMPDFEYPFSHFYVTIEPISGETYRTTPVILFVFKMNDSRTITYGENSLLLFNHDFARALFGKEIINNSKEILRQGDIIEYKDWPAAWQHHLQQAVVSDDPISYMYEEVFGDEESS